MINITAELLMTIGGITAFLLTIDWVRHRRLREKYAVTWIGVAFVLLIIGLFPSLVKALADETHLSYPSAVLFIALAAIYLFAFSVSVSLSRQFRHNTRLLQEIALLEKRLRDVEQKLAGAPGSREAAMPTEYSVPSSQYSALSGQEPGITTKY